ncbi:MAG: hypothetical protein ABGY24_05950 [bacterium]
MLISGTRGRERERGRDPRAGPVATYQQPAYQQMADLQGSIAHLQNDMMIVKASVMSMMQMLSSLMHRLDAETHSH